MQIKGHQSGLHGLIDELKSLCLIFPIKSYYPPVPKGCKDWLFEHKDLSSSEASCLHHTMLSIIKSPSGPFPQTP